MTFQYMCSGLADLSWPRRSVSGLMVHAQAYAASVPQLVQVAKPGMPWQSRNPQ